MSATSPADSSESRADDADSDPRSTQTVEFDGEPVAYAEFGDLEGKPLVFFHGTPGSRLLAELYDEEASARGVRVLTFDRPGYGQSAPQSGYEPTDTADVLAAIMVDAGIDEVGLVAFSGGTPHALAAAAELDSRVRGVDVVSGAIPASFREETPAPQRLLGTLASSAPRLLSGLLRGQAWLARRRPPAFVLAQYTTEAGRDALSKGTSELVKQDFLEALAQSRSGATRESRQFTEDWPFSLSAAESEVRWFHGSDDENVPLAGARRTADALPKCEFKEFENADHLGALVQSREAVLSRYAAAE